MDFTKIRTARKAILHVGWLYLMQPKWFHFGVGLILMLDGFCPETKLSPPMIAKYVVPTVSWLCEI
jgi:hypothetical protein